MSTPYRDRTHHAGAPAGRILWLDTARGIGILLVVFGHVLHGLILGGIATGPGWDAAFVTLYTFHMPLFMVLAGTNIPATYGQAPEAGVFLRRKLVAIGYPYVLWSLVQGVSLILLSAHTNHRVTWGRLLQIGWNPIAQFWFLYALLLYAVVIGIAGTRRGVLIGLAAAAILLEPLATRGGGIGLTLHHAPFFIAGIIGSRAILARDAPPSARAVLGWSALFLVGRALIPQQMPYGYLSLAAYPCALAGIWLVLAMARALRGQAAQWLAMLGRASMPIYVLHLFAASGLRILLVRLGVELPAPVHLLLGTAVGVGAPLAACALLDRHWLLPLLGLGGGTRRERAIRRQATPSFGGGAWSGRAADSQHG